RSVAVHHLGFTASEAIRQSLVIPASPAASVGAVTELWKAAANRRAMLRGGAFTVALALEAAIDWRFASTAEALRRDAGTVQGHDSDVERLQAAGLRFRRLDHTHGGGYALSSLERYLHAEVSPLLTGRYSDATGRELFVCAAMLTDMAAWMAMDSGHHGL